MPTCRTAVNWAAPRSFRISMQNIGGVLGFSTAAWVKWMRGLPAFTEIRMRLAPWRLRSARISSSRLGWVTRSTREPRAPSSSCLTCVSIAPSSGICVGPSLYHNWYVAK